MDTSTNTAAQADNDDFHSRSQCLIGIGFILWSAIGISLANAIWPQLNGIDPSREWGMLLSYSFLCPVFLYASILTLRQVESYMQGVAKSSRNEWFYWGALQYFLVLIFTYFYSTQATYDDISSLLLTLLSPQLAVYCSLRTSLIAAFIADIPIIILAAHQSPVAMTICLFLLHGMLIGFVQESIRAQKSKLDLLESNRQLRIAQQQLATSAKEAERLRIARDLHDKVGHHLVALNIQLEVAQMLADGEAKTEIIKSQGIAKNLLQDVREVVSEMRHQETLPPLDKRIASLIESTRQWAPTVNIQLSSPSFLAMLFPVTQNILYFAVQELLTNALKHGRPSEIRIDFSGEAAALTVRVSDNGRIYGSDIRARQDIQWGNGLNGIQERLTSISGILTTTVHRKGFEAKIQFPLHTHQLVENEVVGQLA